MDAEKLREKIIAEVKRRGEERDRIKVAIRTLYRIYARPDWADQPRGISTLSVRVPRGELHQRISDHLGETLNNEFVARVRGVLLSMGVTPVSVSGIYYYRGLEDPRFPQEYGRSRRT